MLVRTPPGRSTVLPAAVAVALVGTATLLGAFYFQYVMGLPPCPLCLEQRIAYYIAIPLALIVAAAAAMRMPRQWLALALAAIALIMLMNAALGIYHSGVEWKFWPGPQECSGSLRSLGRAEDLFKQRPPVVRCEEAPWRLLGLSLAGYNVLVSLALAGIALWGMRSPRRAPDVTHHKTGTNGTE